MPDTSKQREGRIMVRLSREEMNAVRAAAGPAPVAAWSRRALVIRAKRAIRKRMAELQQLGGARNDEKIVKLSARLDALINRRKPPTADIEATS